MLRALVIYNPYAGRYPSWLLTERAAAVLKKYGWVIDIEKTVDADHISRLAHQAASETMDALFVVGGDGSVNRALSGLMGTQTALGILPAGTGNVWAQELGLPGLSWTRWLALEASAHWLATADVRLVDVGMCNGIPFLMWAGVGLDAFVVHRLEPRSKAEKSFNVLQYAATAVWKASVWNGMNLQVLMDGSQVTGRYLLAIVSNIHRYAGGLARISPNARLDDGEMDFWLFEGKSLSDAVQRAWDLLAGQHIHSNLVHCYPIHSLSIKSDSHLYLQMDGEPFNAQENINVEVRPKALRVLVPASAPRELFINHDM